MLGSKDLPVFLLGRAATTQRRADNLANYSKLGQHTKGGSKLKNNSIKMHTSLCSVYTSWSSIQGP